MHHTFKTSLRRRSTAVALAAAVLMSPFALQSAAVAGPAAAQSSAAEPVADRQPSDHTPSVAAIEGRVARAVARSLTDASWRSQVRDAALGSDTVRLTPLADRADDPAVRGLASRLHRAERRLVEAKGLDAGTGPLLNIRLAADSMRDELAAGRAPLVVAASADESARTVDAFDSRGRAHELDARTVPERPVYVVDIDTSRALAAGLDVLREELATHGLNGAAARLADDAAAAQQAGFWSTRITSIRLSDDKEPWVKGSSEIYTLVTGFGHDGKVRVDPVQMPYLDEDGHTYYPHQVLVNWSFYKYNLADAVMMEEDGGTNYRDLAKALTTALLTITDQGMYIPLVNALLDAIPNDWWTDDPDYVDSWYTLAYGDHGSRNGAAGNGTMTVEPYFVDEL